MDDRRSLWVEKIELVELEIGALGDVGEIHVRAHINHHDARLGQQPAREARDDALAAANVEDGHAAAALDGLIGESELRDEGANLVDGGEGLGDLFQAAPLRQQPPLRRGFEHRLEEGRVEKALQMGALAGVPLEARERGSGRDGAPSASGIGVCGRAGCRGTDRDGLFDAAAPL